MSLKVEGQSCPICHAYLFDDDDIVYCPICGAPHHRDCYNSVGHCGLEELHGTSEQYDRDKFVAKEAEHEKEETEEKTTLRQGEVKCSMCGEVYSFDLPACPKCGTPNISRISPSFAGFDFLGGVPADYNIGAGVTADEAKRFVVTNTTRYVPKFASLTVKHKASWNWAAFLFPCGWNLGRKMYKNGILIGILSITAAILSIPLLKILYNSGVMQTNSYTTAAQNIYSYLPEVNTATVLLAAAGGLLNLVIRILCGIFADSTYKNYCISCINKIKTESDDVDYDYRKKGGISVVALMLGIMAVEYLPNIIYMLI